MGADPGPWHTAGAVAGGRACGAVSGVRGHGGGGVFGFTEVAPAFDAPARGNIAVYRTTTSQWFIAHADGSQATTTFGWSALGDVPVPGDFDGDGIGDLAVYRKTTGEWFMRRSSDGQVVGVSFSAPALGDIAVPADYDGDGVTDLAVYRRTTGEWFFSESARGVSGRCSSARRL